MCDRNQIPRYRFAIGVLMYGGHGGIIFLLYCDYVRAHISGIQMYINIHAGSIHVKSTNACNPTPFNFL